MVVIFIINTDYMCLKLYFDCKLKNCHVHRFILECYNGIIPDKKVINHIDNNKNNNKINNLQCISQKENCNKSIIIRDKSFNKNLRNNKRFIKSICLDDGEIDFFHSFYSVCRDLDVNIRCVKFI